MLRRSRRTRANDPLEILRLRSSWSLPGRAAPAARRSRTTCCRRPAFLSAMRYGAFRPSRTSSLLESKSPVLNSRAALAATSSTDLPAIRVDDALRAAAGPAAAAAGAAAGRGGAGAGGSRALTTASITWSDMPAFFRPMGPFVRARVELRLARLDLRDDDRVRSSPAFFKAMSGVVREHFLRGERRHGDEGQRRHREHERGVEICASRSLCRSSRFTTDLGGPVREAGSASVVVGAVVAGRCPRSLSSARPRRVADAPGARARRPCGDRDEAERGQRRDGLAEEPGAQRGRRDGAEGQEGGDLRRRRVIQRPQPEIVSAPRCRGR